MLFPPIRRINHSPHLTHSLFRVLICFVFWVKQIAICVARNIFLKQSQPWEETVFLSKWQSELPGVGENYKISTDLLRGIAIRMAHSTTTTNDDDDNDVYYWKYLPKESLLPTAPSAGTTTNSTTDTTDIMMSKCFDTLFQDKELWLLDELEPYLQYIIDYMGSTSNNEILTLSNLLLQYTKIITKDMDGISVKFYRKK